MFDQFIALVEQVRTTPDPAKSVVIMVKGIADQLFKIRELEDMLRLGYTLDEHARSLADAVMANMAAETEAPAPMPEAKKSAKKTTLGRKKTAK